MSGLREALLHMTRAAGRGANDRGLLSRLRSAGGVMARHNEYAPDVHERMGYPERLWLQNNEMGVARNQGYGFGNPANPTGVIPEDAFEGYTELERAKWLRDAGLQNELSPYERALLRRADPKDHARFMWGMDDNAPVTKALLLTAGGGGALTLREALAQRMTA